MLGELENKEEGSRLIYTLSITSTAVESKQLCNNSVKVLVYHYMVTIEGDGGCTMEGKVYGRAWGVGPLY